MPEDYGELEDDRQMRVRACQACTTSLINQYHVYQREEVPVEDRTYVYESPLGKEMSTAKKAIFIFRTVNSRYSGGHSYIHNMYVIV